MAKITLRNDRIRKFVEHVKAECKRAGAKCTITDTKDATMSGLRVSGYFGDDADGTQAELFVAGKAALSLETLVHEFAHFIQWDTKSPLWGPDNHHDWLVREAELSTQGRNWHFRHARNIELDAERRAVRLIKKWKLPINVSLYIQQANAYIYFYDFAKRNREWCQVRGPYSVQAIVQLMPKTFLPRRSYDKTPVGYDLLASQHCCRPIKKKK